MTNAELCLRSMFALLLMVCLSGSMQFDSEKPRIANALQEIIVAHHQAIEENSLEKALSFYHSDAPGIASVRETHEIAMAEYYQSTATLAFSLVDIRDEIAIANVKHRVITITGLKISSRLANVTYSLRQENDQWRIWRVTEQSGSKPDRR